MPAGGSSSAPEQWRTRLPQLEQLDPFELELLTVFALDEAGTWLSRSCWKDLAGHFGLRNPLGRRVTAAELSPVCAHLVALDLLRVSGASGSHPDYSLEPDVAMRVLAHAEHHGRLQRLVAAGARPSRPYEVQWRTSRERSTELRVAVVSGDTSAARLVSQQTRGASGKDIGEWVLESIGVHPERAWVLMLPQSLQQHYFAELTAAAVYSLLPVAPDLLELAATFDDKALRLKLLRLAALRQDDVTPADLDPKALPKWGPEGLRLLHAFFAGDYARAAAIGDAACAAMTNRKHKALPDLEGVCHLLASLVCTGSEPERVDAIGRVFETVTRRDFLFSQVEPAIFGIQRVLVGDRSELRSRCLGRAPLADLWTQTLVRLLHDLWLDPAAQVVDGRREEHRAQIARSAAAMGRAWLQRAQSGGYPPVARELEAIVAAFEGERVEARRLASAFRPPAPWEAALARLEVLADAATSPGVAPSGGPLLVWEVAARGHVAMVTPRQRTGPRSKKGTVVSLSRLYDHLLDGSLSPDDEPVASALFAAREERFDEHDYASGYHSGHHSAQGPLVEVPSDMRAVLALVGHPRVIDENGGAITIERGVARLVTRHEGDVTRVELSPRELLERGAVVEQPARGRLVVYERGARLEPFVEILARASSLEVPDAARERLAQVLLRVCVAAGIEVKGDLAIAARTVAADGRIVLTLGWNGAVLSVRASVAPLGLAGPHARPGVGSATLVGEVPDAEAGGGAADVTGAEPGTGGKGPGTKSLRRCRRDLRAERMALDAVLEACPTLASFATDDLSWRVSELEEALEILLEIDAHVTAAAADVVLAWQDGKRLAAPKIVNLDELRLSVKGSAHWLNVDARLDLDEDTVLGFRALLAAREGGRFVPLGRDRFVALSENLRRQLDALADLGSLEGDELRMSTVALTRLDELVSESELDDVSWTDDVRERLEQLREAASFTPRVPRGLQATLRDYQRDGYTWMSRLARAGLGACLADDMGLGKTVQALALLCARQALGPALVVCPTSVLVNWTQEARRFAPSLRLSLLATAEDRAALLSSAGPRDVIVCSYALLAGETDALSEIEFATAVFDEAHALKNHETQRAAAARRISAGFRLGLTGTPVENRVGELWSLFGVLVPGLLGSKASFDERFSIPMAQGDRGRASHLRALLRPFVLRRTKAQVLEELPPRTEITIRVPPRAAERDFYEAVRRRALEKIEQGDRRKKRFRILAEITRLRQAAVDPRLVDPATGPPGAKLDALAHRIVDLRDEGHRALVFSQFLGGMAAVRERLGAEGIEMLELDGSTPAAERARRIEAFQAGEADVFLLSLRAGGIGVNLTAADYVFHLDPWWNPAVEDQATDRAHRIGQTRPVTVYRLVTEGTIEERILELHAAKRQLADDLLEGLDRSGSLDLDELVELLKA